MRLSTRVVLLQLSCLASVCLFAQDFRLIKSLSGPSGKVDGSKFLFDETRTRFVYPADKSFIVYFEWEAPPGTHVLSGIWKQPDGRVAFMSPDIKMEGTKDLNCYWTFELSPGLMSGIWSLEVRIDGRPAGSHPFEIVAPEIAKPASLPEAPKPMSLDQIFRLASPALVWVHKLDEAGRRV